jgi:hypothetical protein
MSVTSIHDAGVGRRVPVTRRSAIRTGGLAALAAGLLGTTPAEASALPPASPLIVGTTTSMVDLVDEVRGYIADDNVTYEAEEAAEGALRETLGPEQHALFETYGQARTDREYITEQMYIAELGRHLSGLAPALWAIWSHMTDGTRTGECCLPTGGPS